MSKNFNTNTTNNDVWLTPPHILEPLGVFDLDPCSPVKRPWDTAKNHYNVHDNGLLLPWTGRVWLNPPYGSQLGLWLQKMSNHLNGIALIFGRTDTEAFHKFIFPFAESILFIKGRLRFYTETGQPAKSGANAPSVLISYTQRDAEILERSGIRGYHQTLRDIFVVEFEVDRRTSTWRVIIGDAMVKLGKKATVREVYREVMRIAPEKVSGNPNYKAKVRQILQKQYQRVNTATYAA